MKRQLKNIVCAICLAAIFTLTLTTTANAETCTSFRCRIQSVISSYFSENSNSNNSFITIIKNNQQVTTPPENNASGNNTITGNNNTSENNSTTTTPPSSSASISEYANEMLRLVNEERKANGLAELQWNADLAKVAQAKAEDMVNNKYFSHTSPTYGSPFEMMKAFGIKYRYAAENIARNSSIEKAHVALMNSDGHRKNILNSNYTSIGIGIVKTSSNSYTIVQMFIG